MKGVINTSSLSKQEKKEKQEKLINVIMWIPLVILLAIVPLIVRMVIIYPQSNVIDVMNQSYIGDIYSNFKATALIILTVIMGVIIFLCIDKENIKYDRTIKWYITGSGIFIGTAFVATLLSDNRHTAWWGMPDRAEGFIVILCYIVILFYALYATRTFNSYKYIIISLSFLVVISTIIGIFQYAGYDLFTKVNFFKNLILGKEGISLKLDLVSDYEKGKVFGTMNHYNYMGSFGAMMVPFFFVLVVCIKNKRKKLGLACMTVCSMFLLFGSTSRAGLIGLISAILVGLIIFIKPILKRWKITLPIVVAFIVVLGGFNAVTGGTIFERIPTLLNDAVGLLGKSDENFDYRDHIPVREVTHEDNTEKIVFQTGTLYLGNDGGDIVFTDESGKVVEYTMDMNGLYSTLDERFKNITFNRQEVTGAAQGQAIPTIVSMALDGKTTLLFMLDDEKGVVLADSCPIKEQEIVDAEAIGFKGKERLGSARGYIWSRSIPMMKHTWLIGYGPDNYALKFPQNDLLAKWWAYDTPNMIVDKPHNLYMNIWINIGGIGLVGFLMMMIAYLVQCFKLYALQLSYGNKEALGIATMLAVVGYLGTGLFNDSVVSVAPIFWILLGAGMAVNYLIYTERRQQVDRMQAIQMKI